MKWSKRLLLLGFIGCLFWLLGLTPDFHGNDVAHIKMRMGKDGYITVNIPKKYIGPSKLSLAREVMDATEPVNMIPMAFTYPDFKPWKSGISRWFMSEEEKRNEVFLILGGGRGEKHGMNGHVYWILGFNLTNKNCHAEPYPEKEYGLFKYKRFYDCLTPHRYHAKDIYFHDAPGDSERDVMIECPPQKQTTELCRFYVNMDDLGLISTDFSARRELVADWRKVIVDYQNFISQFYVDEIPNMKKPTPMTVEEKRERNTNLGDREWKP
jgi:hypothetical protein